MPDCRRSHWPVSTPETRARMARVVALAAPGVLHREIAAQTGYSRSHVSDLLARAAKLGLFGTGAFAGVPPPPERASPLARHGTAERDADLLRRDDAGQDMAEIAAAVGMRPKSVNKRLQTLRRRRHETRDIKPATAPATAGAWPKKLRCPLCREWRTSTEPGDRYHAECRRRAVAWDTGTDPALNGATVRLR